MLVLSRQRDEAVMIGDDIEVAVIDVRGDKVRLGVTAPKEISVHRKEVYKAIQREGGIKTHGLSTPGAIQLIGTYSHGTLGAITTLPMIEAKNIGSKTKYTVSWGFETEEAACKFSELITDLRRADRQPAAPPKNQSGYAKAVGKVVTDTPMDAGQPQAGDPTHNPGNEAFRRGLDAREFGGH